MNSEDIKRTTTMYDILGRYGLKANRHDMICCPFHGEKHASMKIYKDGYNCFACGANGDIFKFVMEYEGVDFKEAFKALGGSYKHESTEDRRKAAITIKRRQMQAETQRRKEERLKKERKDLNDAITAYRGLLEKAEPMSDAWAFYINKLTLLLYKHEGLNP